MEFERAKPIRRPVADRLGDFREFDLTWPDSLLAEQGARCMDCGVPTCHGDSGCPLGNLIPDWNDLIFRGEWERAIEELHRTNNFPDVTGRVCPAPCEVSCVLAINEDPVTIKAIEKSIIDRAFSEGWVRPQVARQQTWKRVAVVGSGPAGLAGAQQLARMGHQVSVFEKSDRLGGLLTYGIPHFKLEPEIMDRRIGQMKEEGVDFYTDTCVGLDLPSEELRASFDAVLLAGGAEFARELPEDIEGRELKGIHLAMEFLTQQNRRGLGDIILPNEAILATGKQVVILGGGDTGADCLGTSHRQGPAGCINMRFSPSLPWCARAPPTRRAESAAGAYSPRVSGVKTASSRNSMGWRWNGYRRNRPRATGRGPPCARFPARNSPSRWNWCCWRWASWALSVPACWNNWVSPSTSAAPCGAMRIS